MKNWDGIDISALYQKVVLDYEKEIETYSYNKIILNTEESVYVIQDTFILYLGLINYGSDEFINYTIVFEELLDNPIFKFNYSKFSRHYPTDERFHLEYKRFHGIWGEPIREQRKFGKGFKPDEENPILFYVDSRADYINNALPELHLRERYTQWEGYLFHFIIYELSDDKQTGYALYYSENPRIHKIAMEKANDVEYCGLSAYAIRKQTNLISTPMIDYDKHLTTGVNCDSAMINILINKIEENKAISWKRENTSGINPNKHCIAEHDLKYFWISRYIKSKMPRDILKVGSEIFKEVHMGKYKDKKRYEYLIPINKWKSEQLVYELTKKIYKKHAVIYQYRPFFLKSDKGQMSYDVFICGLNVAIEYQGKQHFEPVEIFGGEKHFKEQVFRDKLKRELSAKNGVSLVYINYWEDISTDLIQEKIEIALKKKIKI